MTHAQLQARAHHALLERAARVDARAEAFVRTLAEIRGLPELHDCTGHCSGHLRRGLDYALVQCDACGHPVAFVAPVSPRSFTSNTERKPVRVEERTVVTRPITRPHA